MAKPAKKRIGRPPGRTAPHRPVVSARVPQADYDEIVAAARASKRTMAEEVFWRVRKSFEDEKAQADARAILAKAREAAGQELKAAMLSAGLQRVRGIGGDAWFERGVNPSAWIVDNANRDVIEELLTRAVARGVKLARGELS
jgi:hypothetical protein